MKVLILGASGLIGSNLLSEARALGHEVIGTYRNHPLPGLIPLDLGKREDLSDLVAHSKPDAMFFCAGWSWVDGCEGDPQRAQDENVDQPTWAAKRAHLAGSHFTYFSTSYVFDGVSGPYDEDALPNPISVYGRSKRAGEESILKATDGQAIIARTMGVYGAEAQRKNFVYQVRNALASGVPLRVPNDQFGNITFAPHLARMALELAQRGGAGVWNLAGSDPSICRSDFAHQIATSFGLPIAAITPVSTSDLHQAARRPRQGGLLTDKIRQLTGFAFPDWVKID